MVIQFKRKIANEILRYVKSHSLTELELQNLERKLYQIVRACPTKRGSAIQPSLSLNVEQLKIVLPAKAFHLKELNDWLHDAFPQASNGKYHFEVDGTKFSQAVLDSVRRDRNAYGYLDSLRPVQNVCVEFSSPNVAKPFHVGHLRSSIIGNVLSNMYEASGHNVKRINLLGDWGTQFGLVTLGLRRYVGKDKPTLTDLLNAYVQINSDVKSESGSASTMSSPTYQEGMDLFSRLEKGDPELLSLWSQLRTLTMSELDKMYQRLGVTFTHTQYESDYRHTTEEILSRLEQTKLLHYGNDGVGYVPFDGEDQYGRASVVKSDGSSLYLTRDVAAALHRQEEFKPDRMHYVVENGQRGHFIKLVNIMKQLKVPWAQRPTDDIHIRFGRIQGMSTRRGTTVHLHDLLDEAKSKVLASMQSKESTRVTDNVEEVADRLAVSSIILQDLKAHRTKDYTFSWDKMLNFKADSGVFVQYCHARLCSMISNCGVAVSDDVDTHAMADDPVLVKLVIHLARYPEVYDRSLDAVEPHHLIQYLFQLCHSVNAAYAACPVKGENTDLARVRLLVFDSSRQVLANCLRILGLSPLVEI